MVGKVLAIEPVLERARRRRARRIDSNQVGGDVVSGCGSGSVSGLGRLMVLSLRNLGGSMSPRITCPLVLLLVVSTGVAPTRLRSGLTAASIDTRTARARAMVLLANV